MIGELQPPVPAPPNLHLVMSLQEAHGLRDCLRSAPDGCISGSTACEAADLLQRLLLAAT